MSYIGTKLKREIVIDEIITIHYFEYMKDFVFHGETHNFWEFLYVDKGSVSVQAGEKMYQLNSGDIIFHKPNEFHAIQSIGKSSPNLVAISFCTSSQAMEYFSEKYYSLALEERKLISQIISLARETFQTPLHIPSVEQVQIKPDAMFGSEQMIGIFIELFLIQLRQNHPEGQRKEILPIRIENPMNLAFKNSRLEQIIEFMEFHICEQLTIQDICDETSLSRSALQSLFHKEKRCGAMEYFNHMKIERAKDIIRDGTMNFTEIAYFLSYSSLQYFSKQFKKATGMAPIEYSTSVKGIAQGMRSIPCAKK